MACGSPNAGSAGDAGLAPLEVTVSPPPGTFGGAVTLTITCASPATIYVTTDGSDPVTTSATRIEGPSPFKVTLTKSSTVKYFASAGGRDGPAKEGTWVRVAPPGTISGVVVVGEFATGKKLAVSTGSGAMIDLGKPAGPGEVPFSRAGLSNGTYRLVAYSDRNQDGQIVPLIDFASDPVTVSLDSSDTAKAGVEDVRLYLGASTAGLGTLSGVIALPKPPAFQNLQMSLLSPDALVAGASDPMALLQQLQSGYRIFTNTTDTEYPYVLTGLKPGSVIGVPSLFGFGNGGIALNLLANPLKPVRIVADQEVNQNYAFGPVNITGQVTVKAASAPQGVVAFGVVAGRSTSLSDGVQALLMPIVLVKDSASGEAKGAYAGSAIRANQLLSLRVFTDPQTALVSALTWAVSPFSVQPAHASVKPMSNDVVQDITVP